MPEVELIWYCQPKSPALESDEAADPEVGQEKFISATLEKLPEAQEIYELLVGAALSNLN